MRFEGSGFRVQGSGFRVQRSGFRVEGSEASGWLVLVRLGLRVEGLGFRVQSSGLGVSGSQPLRAPRPNPRSGSAGVGCRVLVSGP